MTKNVPDGCPFDAATARVEFGPGSRKGTGDRL